MKKVGEIYVPDKDIEWTPVIEARGHKSYMQKEIECAMRILSRRPDERSSGCAVDVGANIGLYSRRIAKHFPHVFAFEPFEDTAECLKKNTPKNVSCEPFAVDSNCGSMAMKDVNGQEKCGHRMYASPGDDNKLYFPSVTLDSVSEWFEGHGGLTLLKIDVQGMEWEVIDGAMEVLFKYRPVIILEEHKKASTRRAFQTTGRILQEIGGDLCGVFGKNVIIDLYPEDFIP